MKIKSVQIANLWGEYDILPKRSLHKLPAIRQQLLSNPGFGHIQIIDSLVASSLAKTAGNHIKNL